MWHYVHISFTLQDRNSDLKFERPYSRSHRPPCDWCTYLQFPIQVCFSSKLPDLVFQVSLLQLKKEHIPPVTTDPRLWPLTQTYESDIKKESSGTTTPNIKGHFVCQLSFQYTDSRLTAVLRDHRVINNQRLKVGTDYPCPRRHGPYSRAMDTVSKMTPVFTGRVGHQCDQHGPWTRVVCAELKWRDLSKRRH